MLTLYFSPFLSVFQPVLVCQQPLCVCNPVSSADYKKIKTVSFIQTVYLNDRESYVQSCKIVYRTLFVVVRLLNRGLKLLVYEVLRY
jgi:hypothetical protein